MPKQPLCQVCELVVSFLKPFVDSNATEVGLPWTCDCHVIVVIGHVIVM